MPRGVSEERLGGVILRARGAVREIVFAEPDRRNPMSEAQMSGLVQACDRIEAEGQDVAAVILCAEGPVFSAGGDLPFNDSHLQGEVAQQHAFLTRLYRPYLRLLDLPMPTIAAVDGAAVGGGMAIAFLCDIRILSDRARFVTAFAQMGFFPGMGLTYSLERLIGPAKTLELLSRGAVISAPEALALGLSSAVVGPDALLEAARAQAEAIAEQSVLVNRMLKSVLLEGYRGGLRQRLERDILAQVVTSVSGDYASRRASMAQARPTAKENPT